MCVQMMQIMCKAWQEP